MAMPLAVCLVLLMPGSGCATRDQQRTTAYVGLVGLGVGAGLYAIGRARNAECKADDHGCNPWRGAGEGIAGAMIVATSLCVLLVAAISDATIVGPSDRRQTVLPPGQPRTAPRPSARPAPEPEPRPADGRPVGMPASRPTKQWLWFLHGEHVDWSLVLGGAVGGQVRLAADPAEPGQPTHLRVRLEVTLKDGSAWPEAIGTQLDSVLDKVSTYPNERTNPTHDVLSALAFVRSLPSLKPGASRALVVANGAATWSARATYRGREQLLTELGDTEVFRVDVAVAGVPTEFAAFFSADRLRMPMLIQHGDVSLVLSRYRKD